KPEIKYKKESSEIDSLPRKQIEILSASSNYVKPGGILLYSTCTINPYENQRVVKDFLRKNPQFEKIEAIQLLPNINGTDGFYICKMKKAEDLI
ncbi:MAG: 16S rRNA (cytosine(967)-C(5))-methyltransferase RsmB, partial [Peptostreptococcaceae bacterium]|nr:16S rRNA (cytosine(967)-C(5))-methyltransferase RsmB [Peptostreptococcaceae bacterium]